MPLRVRMMWADCGERASRKEDERRRMYNGIMKISTMETNHCLKTCTFAHMCAARTSMNLESLSVPLYSCEYSVLHAVNWQPHNNKDKFLCFLLTQCSCVATFRRFLTDIDRVSNAVSNCFFFAMKRRNTTLTLWIAARQQREQNIKKRGEYEDTIKSRFYLFDSALTSLRHSTISADRHIVFVPSKKKVSIVERFVREFSVKSHSFIFFELVSDFKHPGNFLLLFVIFHVAEAQLLPAMRTQRDLKKRNR